MNEFISELMKVMASYIMVIIIAFFSIGFWFRGLYISFIKVKLSGGRKILVNVRMPTHNYFRVGKIIEGNFLHYVDYEKKSRLINLDSEENENPIYRMGTANAVNVDGTKQVIMLPNLKGIDTYDANKIDSLYVRCLYKPAVFDNKEKLIIGLLVLIVVGLIVIGFINYQMYNQVTALNTI